MEKAKKVKAEVFVEKQKPVHSTYSGRQHFAFSSKALGFFAKLRIGVGVALDLVDFVLANIPILNTLWDFVTFIILLAILKNKSLAFLALGELPLVGLPVLGQIDALIPMATIITIIDSFESKMHSMHKHAKK